MEKITITKISTYTLKHFKFIEAIYDKHNSKEDLEEGMLTFKQFIAIEAANKRIKEGSLFYQLKIDEVTLAGLFEIEDNHLTLLYINSNFQHTGLGTFCVNTIRFLLKKKFTTLTVFASPYSLSFYEKNNFVKVDNDIKIIKGMRYYSMELML